MLVSAKTCLCMSMSSRLSSSKAGVVKLSSSALLPSGGEGCGRVLLL
jgi:hypothetical protein